MKNIKQILIMGLLMLTALSNAQVKIGDNVTTVDSNAVLELESTTKGFVPPRMTTEQRNAINTNVKGMMIYNTTKECTEIYIGIGSIGADAQGWKNMCAANIDATFTSTTLNCAVAGSLVGDYVASQAMTSANKKTVTVTVLTPGDYTISTDEQNGVKFEASGTVNSTGANTQIIMKAIGTSMAAGTFTYTVTLSGQSCTFTVTFANPPAQILNGTVDCVNSSAVSGNYIAGTAMVSGVNTKTIQVTPTTIGYYNFTTNTQNGITFSGSGTFVLGDVNTLKTITLNASGTVTSAGTFTYTVTGTGISTTCNFSVTATASRDYVYAVPTTAQFTNLGDVSFTQKVNNGASVSGTNFTLKANKTYRLTAAMGGYFLVAATDFIDFRWVNSSNVALTASNKGLTLNTNYEGFGPQPTAVAIVTVGSSDMVVKLRAVTVSGGFVFTADRSYAMVEEIPSGLQYLYSNASSNQTLTGTQDIPQTSKINSGLAAVTSGNITLNANKTYRVSSAICGPFTVAGTDNSNLRWYDASNTALASTNIGFNNNTTGTYSWGSGRLSNGIITVGGSNITAKLRVVTSGSQTTDNSRCFAVVDEIPSTTGYLYAYPSSNQALTNGADVLLTSTSANGLNAVTSSNIVLKAGKTYVLEASLSGGFNVTGAWQDVRWVDTSNAALPNSNKGIILVPTYNNYGEQGTSKAVIKVGSTDMTVKLRVVASSGHTCTLDATKSYAMVKQLD